MLLQPAEPVDGDGELRLRRDAQQRPRLHRHPQRPLRRRTRTPPLLVLPILPSKVNESRNWGICYCFGFWTANLEYLGSSRKSGSNILDDIGEFLPGTRGMMRITLTRPKRNEEIRCTFCSTQLVRYFDVPKR